MEAYVLSTGLFSHKHDCYGRTYVALFLLRRHYLIYILLLSFRWKHTGVFSHKCDDCGRTFAAKFALRRHQRDQHGVEMPEDQKMKFVCDVCGRICRTPHVLARHKMTHTKEKPHKCHVCSRAFATKVTLEVRLSRHAALLTIISGILNAFPSCTKTFIKKRKITGFGNYLLDLEPK